MKGLFAAAIVAWLISGTVHANTVNTKSHPVRTAADAGAAAAAGHSHTVLADIRSPAICAVHPGLKRLAC